MAATTRTSTWATRRGADRLDFAGFEEAEEERLHAQAHLADFVEEEGAAVGHLQLAAFVAVGAGEAALDVSEELRFEERLGQAGAVDGDERPAGALRVGMDMTRDDVFADTALPGDEDFRIARRRPLGDLEDVEHGGTARDDRWCADRIRPGRSPRSRRKVTHC